MQMGLLGHGFVRGFLPVQRNESGRGRIRAGGQRKVRRLRKMHQLLPQASCQESACKRKILRGMLQLLERRKGSARGMHGGVPRLRTLCKCMPQRRNNSSKQPCRHRLLQMHRLRNMRVEMPLQMHFGNKTARQMICKANLGK